MGLLGKIVYTSNHGTAQGIISRFFFHFEEMSKMAFFGDLERKKRYKDYYDKNLNDFTNFYDSYQQVIQLRKEYIEGIISGKYYKHFENGEFTADKSPEVKIMKSIQDFFKDGKPFLNNFAKSKLLDDGVFELEKLLVVSEKNYNRTKLEITPNLKLKGYEVLFNIIEDAQTSFKKDFFLIRDKLEHNYMKLPDFEVKTENGITNIIDPHLDGKNIFMLIDLYYSKTLDLIEDLAAHFFGNNACFNSNGIITLFYNNGRIEPENFRYRYKITLDVNDSELTKLIF